MSVLIIIKRVFRMDQSKQLVPLLQKLREESEKQPGFISRTTYSKLNDPGELVVIMEWKTVDDWINWMANQVCLLFKTKAFKQYFLGFTFKRSLFRPHSAETSNRYYIRIVSAKCTDQHQRANQPDANE